MNIPNIRKRLRDPSERVYAAIEVGDFARDLCLVFDSELMTAHAVGAEVANSLVKEFEKRDKDEAENQRRRIRDSLRDAEFVD